MQSNKKNAIEQNETQFTIGSKTFVINNLTNHLRELFELHHDVKEVRHSISHILFRLAQGDPLEEDTKEAIGNLELLDSFLKSIQTDLSEVA